MIDARKIKLHYFDARGRAQFIRYYFELREIAFTDHRIPLSADFHEWMAVRDDQTITGPFKRLPLLVVDGQQVAETLTIANYLHALSGDALRLSEEDNLRHAQLLSSLHGDLMLPLGTVVWVDRMYPGVDLDAYLRLVLGRLRSYLAVLQDALDTWRWLERLEQRPVMLADCLLWEELDAFERIVGPAVSLGDYPRLAAYHRGCPSRDRFTGYLAAHPSPFTGRGMTSEAEMLERIREICVQIKAEDKSESAKQ